ncbi:MAG: DUF4407 domain-containing protein [Bacteroidota bacterium]
MLKFACRITGDDYQMLKSETTPSRKKVLSLAIAVFIPTIMWFITGFLMVYSVFEKSFATAFLSGLVAATMILIIEKLVVMSSGSKLLLLFRIVLAFLVAVVGSVFLDEVIFAKDITQQLSVNQYKILTQKKEDVLLAYKDELMVKQGLAEQKYQAWQQSLQAAEREADGSAGSGIKGVHAITKLKLTNAGINQGDYTQAKAELVDLQLQLKSEQDKEVANVKAGFENNALLQRIKAMFDLVKTDRYMMVFYFMVTAILFTLEFLVVVFKVTMGKTNYERRLELIEEIGQRRMEKVRQNDLKYFEAGKVSPDYRQAQAKLKTLGASLFN